MFDGPGPRLFGVPPGADFARAVVDGLRARVTGPPEALARVTIYVNGERMARRLRAVFDAGPPSLLPAIRLVTDLSDPVSTARLPVPEPDLRLRLRLTELVSRLLDAQPDLASRSALFDLADSLADLIEEAQGEGVSLEAISEVDVGDLSGHWQRTRIIFGAVAAFLDERAPTRAACNRLALQARLSEWEARPPDHPILVAGSTGSRGTTAGFMAAVARLPRGAVILPGFDFHMPADTWQRLDTPLTGEDHPQFRFARLMQALALDPGRVQRWSDVEAPDPARARVLSLALRPAPVTHQWLTEGARLGDLRTAMARVTILEAPTPRDEATAIALRLREAAETGQSAALVTPDRTLTRQVSSALDRWGILPDDSAGTPAQLTPPGRFLRHVATLLARPLTAETLLTLLKHPLTHTGAARGEHLRRTRDLELRIRKKSWPYPRAQDLRQWADGNDAPGWGAWVAEAFCDRAVGGRHPLADWTGWHLQLAEKIATGSEGGDASALWDRNAGRALLQITEALSQEAAHGTAMDAADYADLFGALLAREEVRDRDAGHPRILILGTLEARAMDVDLAILAGLTEGGWPEMPKADPWLNRTMRADLGLLLPERRIGLSAHDFQQAAAAREIWLSRPLRSDEAETVPSRWLNRLTNLLQGLPACHGPESLREMTGRGNRWLALARQADAADPVPPEPRPSPAPPLDARPVTLPVTAIKRLVRDPFAIYARAVLRLKPLQPLMREPDALFRGILLHEVIETYLRRTLDGGTLSGDALAAHARAVLSDPATLPFPTARVLWSERLARVADWFAESEAARQSRATPHDSRFEIPGTATLTAPDFTLTAKADRIDIDGEGRAHLYDYKTGNAPSKKEQIHFDRQLLLEAAILERGGFRGLGAIPAADARYIALAPSAPKEVGAPLGDMPPGKVWEEFTRLIVAYADEDRGYTARRAVRSDKDVGDYDQLARFGEWDAADPPCRVRLR